MREKELDIWPVDISGDGDLVEAPQDDVVDFHGVWGGEGRPGQIPLEIARINVAAAAMGKYC